MYISIVEYCGSGLQSVCHILRGYTCQWPIPVHSRNTLGSAWRQSGFKNPRSQIQPPVIFFFKHQRMSKTQKKKEEKTRNEKGNNHNKTLHSFSPGMQSTNTSLQYKYFQTICIDSLSCPPPGPPRRPTGALGGAWAVATPVTRTLHLRGWLDDRCGHGPFDWLLITVTESWKAHKCGCVDRVDILEWMCACILVIDSDRHRPSPIPKSPPRATSPIPKSPPPRATTWFRITLHASQLGP